MGWAPPWPSHPNPSLQLLAANDDAKRLPTGTPNHATVLQADRHAIDDFALGQAFTIALCGHGAPHVSRLATRAHARALPPPQRRAYHHHAPKAGGRPPSRISACCSETARSQPWPFHYAAHVAACCGLASKWMVWPRHRWLSRQLKRSLTKTPGGCALRPRAGQAPTGESQAWSCFP